MKRYVLILIIWAPFALLAQNQLDTAIMNQIEANNTALQAFRQQVDARKMNNRTGLSPDNPQVQVNYFWGSPSIRGNRTDLNVTQTIDFPTAYRHRLTMAAGRDGQAEIDYQRIRKDLRLQVSQLVIELVYRYRQGTEFNKRLRRAKGISSAYQLAFEQGEVNVLDRNKAKVSLLNAEKVAGINEVEQQALLDELVRFNGGIPLLLDTTVDYPDYVIPADFELWYAGMKTQNVDLVALENEIAISVVQEKLNKALSLPQISAGYMSERETEVRFNGVSVGLSIPLWQHKNTVRHAKLQTTSLKYAQVDAEQQYYNSQKMLYNKAVKLKQIIHELKETLGYSNNAELLKKALDNGQLNLMDYLKELSMYDELMDNYMETERAYYLVLVELWQWAE